MSSEFKERAIGFCKGYREGYQEGFREGLKAMRGSKVCNVPGIHGIELVDLRVEPKFAIHSHPVEVLEPVPSETKCSHPGDTLYTGVVKPVEERRTMSINGRSPMWQDRDGRWTDRGCGRPPKPATYPTPTEPGWYWVEFSTKRRIVEVHNSEPLYVHTPSGAWRTVDEVVTELGWKWGPRIPDWRPEVPHA